MRSVHVVLPASMCAMMPMLRYMFSGISLRRRAWRSSGARQRARACTKGAARGGTTARSSAATRT
jgi:hypothetical protein